MVPLIPVTLLPVCHATRREASAPAALGFGMVANQAMRPLTRDVGGGLSPVHLPAITDVVSQT